MKENAYRSVIKALSWRITGTLDTIVVSFIISKELKIALSIGFVEVFTKIALYYVHERAWNRIQFGRIKELSSDYMI